MMITHARPANSTSDSRNHKATRAEPRRPCPTARAATAACVALFLAAASLAQPPAGETTLREELLALVRAGETSAAIDRAQSALKSAPADASVRREYVDLHVSLARAWIAQRRFEAALAALEAAAAVEPDNPQAQRLLGELRDARQRADKCVEEVDRLLRLELFDAALDALRDAAALRPELAASLAPQRRAAWLGAADDHYLARNFSEAFALYEQLLAIDPDAPPQIRTRWRLAAALALAEQPAEALPPDAAARLGARLRAAPGDSADARVAATIGALLAERAGRPVEAGRGYCDALGEAWSLPPADQRRARVDELRSRALVRLRETYGATPTQRRGGFWSTALPSVWKSRNTPHFEVHARNDLIAERVADALEHHFAGLSAWLGVEMDREWTPRCVVRIHATQAELHAATQTSGIAYSVSNTRWQDGRIVARTIDGFQGDPWLLAGTLPHEVARHVVTQKFPEQRPLAVAEGVALQAEPPARRLLFRRLLNGDVPDAGALLATDAIPDSAETFAAHSDALVGLLILRAPADSGGAQPPAATLLRTAFPAAAGEWWRAFGWQTADAWQRDWREWCAARGRPARMPLMIQAPASAPAQGDTP